MNKVKIFSIVTLLFTTAIISKADDFDDFQIVQKSFGYSGLEAGVSFKNIGINFKSKGLLEDRYIEIKEELDDTKNYLERDNYDKDIIFNLLYRKVNTKNYNFNQEELIIGRIIDDDSRLGLKLIYADGKAEYNNVKNNLDKLGGQLFYHHKGLENSFSLIGYLNGVKAKNEKLQDIGANFNFKHSLNNYYFDVFDPGTYIDINFVSIDHKKDEYKKKNMSTTTEIGTEFKNEIERNDIKLTSGLKIGYEREFLDKKNFKSLYKDEKYKNKDVDGIIARIGINIKYAEIVDFSVDGKIRKSLNKNNLETIGTVGFKVSF